MYEIPDQQWLAVQERGSESYPYRSSSLAMADTPAPGISLLPLLNGLERHWIKILGAACIAALIAFIVCKRLTPLYESTATLEINSEHGSDLLGPDAARSVWSDADQFIATQLRVIQEDSVLRPVVERNNIPLGKASDDPNAPITLKKLRVIRPPNTYLIQVSYRASDPIASANIANGISDSYLRHVFHSRLDDRKIQTNFMERQLDEVRAAMERSAKAVNEFESRIGVVDPQDKTNILSARLMQLSTEYTSAQADRIKKEADYLGLQDGSLSSAQQSDQGENLKALQTQIDQAEQKFVEVREHFGLKHPEYQKNAAILAGLQAQMEKARSMVGQRSRVSFQDAKHREQILQHELADEKASFDKLNAKSYQYQALKIEAEGNRKLYDDLERRIKESTINGSFQNSAIHVTDPARPAIDPVFPRTKLNVGLAFLFTLLIGIGVAVGLEFYDDTIRTAGQIESNFHVDVLGSIPRCNLTEQPTTPLLEGDAITTPITLPVGTPALTKKRSMVQRRIYDEAVRMLWSSFQLASVERGIRTMLVTSAIPEEGKTTLTTRLALIHATHGRRTLLIDADLRRPSAHRHVHVALCPGLAEVSRSETTWRAAVVSSNLHPQLDILPAGAASARSCDDIAQLLPRLLMEAGSEYDLILVDGPPLLAFADPLHMACAVDGVLVVVCAEKTNSRTLALTLQTLKRVRAHLVGVALNRVAPPSKSSDYAYRYYNERIEAA